MAGEGDSNKVAVIAGYGTGISSSVAQRFGAEGYKLALLARTASRLNESASKLSQSGITAKGYPTDLADPAAVKAAIAAVHQDLGPINVLFWNAYGNAPGLLPATPEELQANFNTLVTGLIAAVQAAHEDLTATKGAVLVTGGGLSLEDDACTQLSVDLGATSLSVCKAAQRKLVHILSKGLAGDGIYVAEVTVIGLVKGTAFDPEGKSNLTAESIADEFWTLAHKRDPAVWFVTKQQQQ